MDFGAFAGKHIGNLVEKTIVSAFSSDDKDKDKDKDSGGILSFFGGDKDDKDKDDGGLFSFGRDDEKKKDKKDDENDGFFSRLLNRDGDDDKTKKSGFHGLFNEQQGAADSHGDQEGKDSEGGGVTFGGGGSGVSEGDLLSDLMDVAEEQSQRQ